jgi:cell filamentation protein
MYQAERDPYCYPGSEVLINKAGHRTQAALDDFEAAMTFARAEEPLPAGRFSVRHYRALHRHLFQDVYNWAGKYRTVRLSKGTSTFCYPEHIAKEMTAAFASLKAERLLTGRTRRDFARGAAHFMAEVNAIHPFREGNGRTLNTFLVLLAAHAGHEIDLDRLQPERLLRAMIKSFKGNEAPLAAAILDLIP